MITTTTTPTISARLWFGPSQKHCTRLNCSLTTKVPLPPMTKLIVGLSVESACFNWHCNTNLHPKCIWQLSKKHIDVISKTTTAAQFPPSVRWDRFFQEITRQHYAANHNTTTIATAITTPNHIKENSEFEGWKMQNNNLFFSRQKLKFFWPNPPMPQNKSPSTECCTQ